MTHPIIKISILGARVLLLLGLGIIGIFSARAGDAYAAGGSYWEVPIPMSIPPWQSQYKLRPGETDRLTGADVVGPDGVVYPNWKNVGVQGGIPDVPVVVSLADLGAQPSTDISGLILTACANAAALGGGAILIGPGTFFLDSPVVITQSNVVIRGSGRDVTRLVFRYSLVNPKAMTAWQIMNTWPEPSAFLFKGGALEPLERPLAADGKRGDTVLSLNTIGDLQVGDKIMLRAPVTARWRAITKDQSPGAWGNRSNYYEIRAINTTGNTIAIGQPLRIDFPVIDGSNLRRMFPIQRCGVEALTIEHTDTLPIHTVSSQWAWNCWVKNVRVLNSGRSGVHWMSAKWCEVRDCEFDSCWNHGGGGMGYGGFTQASDCLMDGCQWINYRHAPMVQFGAQGNVIRNCTMEGSDAQWHAGWSTENLFENCVILPPRTTFTDSTPRYKAGGYGAYGFGMYSTPSNDTDHGPNGPRNVVYNCDVRSQRDGVYGRGASENWLFLHNRFVVDGIGAGGFYAESGFFDTIIRNNVFVLKDSAKPMLYLRTPDCVGIELVGNTVYGGSGAIVAGVADAALNQGNQALPAVELAAATPPRPVATPASIYLWQKIPYAPTVPNTLYAMITGPANAAEVTLYWQSTPGRMYTVEATTNLNAGFNIILNSNIPATAPMNIYIDKVNNVSRKFYRIVTH